MNSEINPINMYAFNEIAEVNPPRTVKKGTVTKYLSMDSVNPRQKHVSKIEYRKYNGGSKFKKNDILFARITPSLEHGKTCIVDFLDDGEIGAGSTEFIVISSKNGLTIPDYLYYLTTSNLVREPAIKSMTGTSGRQRVDTSVFDSIIVPIPPLKEQKVIAKILSDLDSKIELNQKMNKTLEAIAQAIFKHWFIDFEFPNEGGKPYKSSGGEMVDSELGEIPKGWQVKYFKDVVSLTMGVSPKGNSYNTDGFGVPLLNGAADFSNGMIEPKKFTTNPVKMCKEGDLLFCIRATIGNLTYSDKEYCIGRGVAALSPNNEIFKAYSYFTLEYGINELISKASGSVIRGLSKDDILLYKVLVPTDKIIAEFHLLASAMFSRMRYLNIETHSLSNVRDSLLPKLMSGKIRVPLEE